MIFFLYLPLCLVLANFTFFFLSKGAFILAAMSLIANIVMALVAVDSKDPTPLQKTINRITVVLCLIFLGLALWVVGAVWIGLNTQVPATNFPF